MASAKDAKEALEGITGGDWDDPDGSREMIDQINQYYRQQMNLFNSMYASVKSAAKMASNIASSMSDISVGGEGGSS